MTHSDLGMKLASGTGQGHSSMAKSLPGAGFSWPQFLLLVALELSLLGPHQGLQGGPTRNFED